MRRLLIVGIITALSGIATSAGAQRPEFRTVMRDGMECREKKQVKKDGRRSYDLKCKDVKPAKHKDRDDRDDRYENDGRHDDDDRGRTSSECVDADRDGRCDRGTRPTRCTDRDRDGWCDGTIDGSRRYPSTLPEVIGDVIRGRRSAAAQRWLGSEGVTARRIDTDRDGRADRVTWLDGSGRVVQRWIDTDRDGRANVVHVYRNGELLRIIAG